MLDRIAAGDHEACQQLFGQYWPQVYGTCLRPTKSAELSKDLAQDIFIKVWDQRLRLTGVKKTDAFLYTIARNTVMDHFRKQVLDPQNDDFFQTYFQPGAVSPQQKLEYKELEAALEKVCHHPGVQNAPGLYLACSPKRNDYQSESLIKKNINECRSQSSK